MKFFIIFFASTVSCFAQTYPRWFLDPVGLNCGLTACGYAQNYFQKGSSDSAAFLEACENLTRQHYVKIEGGEAYWATESGVYWMGNNLRETIDSSSLRNIMAHAKKLCGYSGKNVTLALIADDSSAVPDSMLSNFECSREAPAWAESLPQGSGYVYAIGIAPQFFYESSSWESAEKKARFNLARSIKVTVQSLQKSNHASGQDIRNEEVSAELVNVEVVHRWRDVSRGLYYVLVRMRNW